MSLPFFYHPGPDADAKEITLDEDNSKHIVNVLRMKEGEELLVTDGMGNSFTGEITDAHKKHCRVRVISLKYQPPSGPAITIAISLIKNNQRFEWFLEKATEIGVNEIQPVISERTEKQKFRMERMHSICVSAMLQSQQCWLPRLSEPLSIKNLIAEAKQDQKFIAYCGQAPDKTSLSSFARNASSIILIGPEGDFTQDEVALALKKDFIAVSLGSTRLRTETAGIVAATLLRAILLFLLLQ